MQINLSENQITTGEFVCLLWNSYTEWNKKGQTPVLIFAESPSLPSLLKYGHKMLWLEDEDELYPEFILTKRTAARILHQFMKIEMKIPDSEDISKAQNLRDLYTCRVCANHVAQVFVKNIMDCEEVEINGEAALIFNMLKPLTIKECNKIMSNLF